MLVNYDRIVKQGTRISDNVCVSWWESGRVTQDETIWTYDENYLAIGRIRNLPDLPNDTPCIEAEYYKVIVNDWSGEGYLDGVE